MPERATLNQVTQVGVETTPGTGVAANKLLQAFSITPGIQANVNRFRPVGGKFTTIAALGKEWIEARIEGQACYNHLAYLLSSVLAYAAPAQQGATAAYLWTHKPAQTAEDAIKTFTVEQGSSVRAGKFAYGLVTEFTLRFDRETVEVSGAMLGQAYQDNITMTAAPTAVAVMPVQPTQIDVYLDSTSGGIGTTKLTRALRGEFSIGDRFNPLWAINSAVSGFAAHVETAPNATLKLLVEADSVGMGPLTALRAGDKRYLRVKAVGPLIATSYYYTLQLDLCGVVAEVGEFSDEDGVYGIEWTFEAAYDSAWSGGTALQAQLTNVLTAL
ncbi:MAG TPA: hypothetical protein PLD43_00460 [Anaerolineae bacterium]|nr:hypothetical protein [Anaerolineae bacterium]